jgi:hypothetical protein
MPKVISQQALQTCLETGWLPCQEFHDHDCLSKALAHFLGTFQASLKVYLPIHLVSLLLRLRKSTAKGSQQLSRFLVAWLKSAAFASSYVMLLAYYICFSKNVTGRSSGLSAFLTRQRALGQPPRQHQRAARGPGQEGRTGALSGTPRALNHRQFCMDEGYPGRVSDCGAGYFWAGDGHPHHIFHALEDCAQGRLPVFVQGAMGRILTYYFTINLL